MKKPTQHEVTLWVLVGAIIVLTLINLYDKQVIRQQRDEIRQLSHFNFEDRA